MASGKYAAISGMISRMQMLENINRNLANINTSGYKKGMALFEATLTEAQSTTVTQPTNFINVVEDQIDFTQGGIQQTGNPMNLAINGKGFFKILQADGQIGYARRGNFQRNAAGELVTSADGKLLAEGDAPLVLPAGDFGVTQDGSVMTEDQLVGKIPLYLFADTSVLRRSNDGIFVAPSSAQPTVDPKGEMIQGSLEGSNVNMLAEMARMTSNTRSFEAAQKALTAYDKMDSRLAELGQIQ